MVTHVLPFGDNGIRVNYCAGGNFNAEVVYSILKYSDKTERNQKMTEMYKWLNQKD